MDFLGNDILESPNLEEMNLDNADLNSLGDLSVPDLNNFDPSELDDLDNFDLSDLDNLGDFDLSDLDDLGDLDLSDLGDLDNLDDSYLDDPDPDESYLIKLNLPGGLSFNTPSNGKFLREWINEHNFGVQLQLHEYDGCFSRIDPHDSRQNKNDEHSAELMDGKLLNKWMSTYYPQINLSLEQCNLIIESLDPCYVLVNYKQSLYPLKLRLTNMDDLKKNKHISITSFRNTPDKIIESACKLSHENIAKLAKTLARTPYFDTEAYSQCLNSLTKCCNQNQKLLDLFKQSRFENWKPVIKDDSLKQQSSPAEQQANQTEEAPKAHRRKKR